MFQVFTLIPVSASPPVAPDRLLSYKSDRQESEVASGLLDPFLAYILFKAARQWWMDNRCYLLITSVYRTPYEDEALDGHGIHPAWRAVDIHADSWTDPKIAKLADWINFQYEYDKYRPEMLVALWEPHGDGPHLHCQTHQNSTWRKV